MLRPVDDTPSVAFLRVVGFFCGVLLGVLAAAFFTLPPRRGVAFGLPMSAGCLTLLAGALFVLLLFRGAWRAGVGLLR